ncbi:MAG: Lrp/AsnC family transcriptional regulator [Hellea sp.]|jgi:DNA-binding Lrp family transcriptional regulator|nr:Lrp/AsnC family transcriptional regulator [Hellea sp.]MDA9931958.1 Lrp/AsnC family transcriptional regulator [bacterium]MBT3593761.1 Lrp/AsnC family transcriptional regulator [Hellea sp.]MBT4996912.1 Lrp/AsnC family transcriptional regulator [Hellea sp.]MBT5837028.1 Lrp/AsnC family transcriptional regulator [Hellea sp.]MBT7399346.1 Lrp/AsnC family transcriptional regulator [Hellea sp.]
MPIQIDGIDAKILNIIQKDASISVADIADEVGLSSSPCWRRIKRMEELGIIKNRVTILDRTKLGLDFEVFVAVKLALPNRENMEKLERAVANMPEVVQCASVTGAVDFMLRVVTKDMHCYEDFLREVLLSIDLISDVQSRIVLRQTKESNSIPLNLISNAVPRV